jgi:hypothetical protein
VHFAGPRAYVVTFRRTDPLYVIDLANPAQPRVTGELEMPGFSDYLFPLADGRLLGIGREASNIGFVSGVKIALFDVADPAQPRLLDSRVLGERGSSSALDYSRHGINLLAQGDGVRIALPVLLYETVDGTLRYSRQGLARYTADLQAGKLVERPFHVATTFDGTSADVQRWQRYSLWNERSIQSAASTYYFSGGEVTRIAEP